MRSHNGAVVGYGNRSDREEKISFYRLPALIFHGAHVNWRDVWLTRIHSKDLGHQKYSYARVCSLHFIISGNLTSQVH